jgi:alkylation response protein AidB-like acyl-CoA dehydrogenase
METDNGYDRDGWRSINTELGLTAVRIPEAYGGQGFGFGEQCIVLEEMGRALLCAPFFATAVLAAGAILNAGTETEQQALLPGIATGETIATFAWVEDNGRWGAEGMALTATAAVGGTVLNGHKTYVVDGHTADLIVVLARATQGLSVLMRSQRLDLTDNERAVLITALRRLVDFNPQPLSPQIQALKAILERLEPQKPQPIPDTASTG